MRGWVGTLAVAFRPLYLPAFGGINFPTEGLGPLRSPFLYIKLWRMVMPCGVLPPERLLLEDDLIRFDDRRCGNEGGDFGHLRLQVGTTRPASPRVGFGLPQRDICTKRETR